MLQQNHNIEKESYDIGRLAMRLLGIHDLEHLSVNEVLSITASAFNFHFAGLYQRTDESWSLKHATHNGFYYESPNASLFFTPKPNLLFTQTRMKIVKHSQYPEFFDNYKSNAIKRSAQVFLLPFRLSTLGHWVFVCVQPKSFKSWAMEQSAHLALMTQNLVTVLGRKNGIQPQNTLPLGQLHHVMRNGLHAIRMLVDGLFKECDILNKYTTYKNHLEKQIEEMTKTMDALPKG